MALVKLDATTSTNDFLKEMATDPATENFTVVTAESQTKGRGQMGAQWVSQYGKNLMMSVLIKDVFKNTHELFTLNVAVALAIIETLAEHDIGELSIKWPNDIMAGSKKIGGILIENRIKGVDGFVSVVGIGLNVNQEQFEGLPKAGSLYTVTRRIFDRESLRESIVANITRNVERTTQNDQILWRDYLSKLFKIGVPMPFEDSEKNRFMAIAQGVSRDGRLELRLEDDSRKSFGIKEVQMLY